MTNKNSEISNNNDYDDLTKLDFIGEARERDIRTWFGVRTFQDYAILSPSEVESRFELEGKRFPIDEIEKSIAHAHKLAKLSLENEQSVEVEINSSNDDCEWEYIAAFNVEFKVQKIKDAEDVMEIIVRPVEITKDGDWLDTKGEKPTPVTGEELYQWMLEQLTEKTPSEPGEVHKHEKKTGTSYRKIPIDTTDVKMKITEVLLYQPPEIETPTVKGEMGKPFHGLLVGDQPFDLQVSFDLVGSDTKEVTKKNIPFSAKFLTRELPLGEPSVLGNTDPKTLLNNHTSYKVKLSDVSLSPGVYCLQIFAKLFSSPPIHDYLEVPLLQVI
jgi:hypothetical protein